MRKIESLTEKDLHCIARILQGCEYKDSMLYCCNYCLYQVDCLGKVEGNRKMYFFEVAREKLQNITGVYLGKDARNIAEKFLLNSYQTTSKSVFQSTHPVKGVTLSNDKEIISQN